MLNSHWMCWCWGDSRSLSPQTDVTLVHQTRVCVLQAVQSASVGLNQRGLMWEQVTDPLIQQKIPCQRDLWWRLVASTKMQYQTSYKLCQREGKAQDRNWKLTDWNQCAFVHLHDLWLFISHLWKSSVWCQHLHARKCRFSSCWLMFQCVNSVI